MWERKKNVGTAWKKVIPINFHHKIGNIEKKNRIIISLRDVCVCFRLQALFRAIFRATDLFGSSPSSVEYSSEYFFFCLFCEQCASTSVVVRVICYRFLRVYYTLDRFKLKYTFLWMRMANRENIVWKDVWIAYNTLVICIVHMYMYTDIFNDGKKMHIQSARVCAALSHSHIFAQTPFSSSLIFRFNRIRACAIIRIALCLGCECLH